MSSSRRPPGNPRSTGRKPTAPPKQATARRASSRPTIKPGPPAPIRARLVLSTKPRPPGRRLLSDVELDEDEVLVDSFIATLEGVSVRITAVLERTCVYVDRDGDRRLARKQDLWVEADKLPIRRRGIG